MTQEIRGSHVKFSGDLTSLIKDLRAGKIELKDFEKALESSAAAAQSAADRSFGRMEKAVAKLSAELKGSPATAQLGMIEKAVERIGGVANLTGPQLDNLKNRIEACVRAGGKLPASLQGIATSTTGVNAALNSLKADGLMRLSATAGQLGPLGGALAALGPAGMIGAAGLVGITAAAGGVVAGLSGLIAATQRSVQAAVAHGDAVEAWTNKTQMGAIAVQDFMRAAEHGEVPFERVAAGSIKMQNEIVNGSKAFAQLGLDVANLKNMLPEDALRLVSEHIAQISNKQEQLAASSAIFGAKAGGEMLAFAKSLATAVDEGDRFGRMTEDQVMAAAEMDAALTDLDQAWQGLVVQFGAAVVEGGGVQSAVESVTDTIADLIALVNDNKGAIGLIFDKVAEKATQTIDTLRHIAMSPVFQAMALAPLGLNHADLDAANDRARNNVSGAASGRLGSGRTFTPPPKGSRGRSATRSGSTAMSRRIQLDDSFGSPIGSSMESPVAAANRWDAIGARLEAEARANRFAPREGFIPAGVGRFRETLDTFNEKTDEWERSYGRLVERTKDDSGWKVIDEGARRSATAADALKFALANVTGILDVMGIKGDKTLTGMARLTEAAARGDLMGGLSAGADLADQGGIVGTYARFFTGGGVLSGIGSLFGGGDKATGKGGNTGMDGADRLIDMLLEGRAKTEDVRDAFDEAFNEVAANAIDRTSGLLTDSTRRMIELAESSGIASEAIKDLMRGQAEELAGNLAGALGGMKERRNTAAGTAGSRAERRTREQLAGSGLSDEEIEARVRRAGNAAADEAARGVGLVSQAAATAFSTAIVGDFAKMLELGLTRAEAFERIAPAVRSMREELTAAGFEGGHLFNELEQTIGHVTNEFTGPLFTAISSTTGAMANLANMNMLNRDLATGFTQQISGSIAELERQGVTGPALLQALQPDLQRIWEMQQKYKFEVDATTQAKIDEAVASGRVGDEFRSSTDKMVSAAETTARAVEAIAVALGAIPDKAALAAGAIGKLGRTHVNVAVTTSGTSSTGVDPSESPEPEDDIPGFKTGSDGVLDFGERALIAVHGKEAIVPEPDYNAMVAAAAAGRMPRARSVSSGSGPGAGGAAGGVMYVNPTFNITTGANAKEVAVAVADAWESGILPQLTRAARSQGFVRKSDV